jgi:hypothetical protein
MAMHRAHAVTCDTCGCTRECDGRCAECQVCGGPTELYPDETPAMCPSGPRERRAEVSPAVDAALRAWAEQDLFAWRVRMGL